MAQTNAYSRPSASTNGKQYMSTGKENPHISAPMQLRLVLFQGQLYVYSGRVQQSNMLFPPLTGTSKPPYMTPPFNEWSEPVFFRVWSLSHLYLNDMRCFLEPFLDFDLKKKELNPGNLHF